MTFQSLSLTDSFGTRTLKYEYLDGQAPVIVWLGGYRSDMCGTKAETLRAFCLKNNQAFLRFDYSGHGQSLGEFVTCTLSQWLKDCEAILEVLHGKPPLLVGSSMGGWLGLLLSQKYACAGLVLLAPAPDFTKDLMWDVFPQSIRHTLQKVGVYHRPSAYSDIPDTISYTLIKDGETHCILHAPLQTHCPVTILHGTQDEDVPLAHVEKLVACLIYDPLTFILIPEGDHRLSRPQDLATFQAAIEKMLKSAPSLDVQKERSSLSFSK